MRQTAFLREWSLVKTEFSKQGVTINSVFFNGFLSSQMVSLIMLQWEIIFHRAIFYCGMWGLLVSYLLQCIFPLHKLKYFRKSLSKQLQKKKNLLLRNFAIYRRLRLKFLCDSTGTATCQTTVINGSTLLGY